MHKRLLLGIVFLFYFWTATGGWNTFNLDQPHGGMYNLLTDAFLAGQLNFLIEPKPELLALPDPYDPSSSWGLRLHDAALYKGKYYLTYGQNAALLLYLPYRLITNQRLPDNLAVLIFSFGALIWATILLYYLRNRYFKNIPEWMVLIVVGTIAFANVLPYNLRRTDMYEVSISSGIFFLLGGIYWLCKATEGLSPHLAKLCLGSLFLGLAIGCRPPYVLSGFLLFLVWNKILKTKTNNKSLFKAALVLILPYSLCLLAQFIYNYLRFESPFEFGLNYVLTVINSRTVHFFNIENIFSNLYFYLFQPPIIDSSFPFIHVNPTIPTFLKIPTIYYFEKTVGIISGIPFLLLLFLGPFIYCWQNKLNFKAFLKKETVFRYFEFWILLLSALLYFCVIITAVSVTMRYVADFATQLIIIAGIVWFYFDTQLVSNPSSRRLLRTIAVVLSFISILIGVALGIIGCYDGLKAQNAEQFRKLEQWCTPISRAIFKYSPDWKTVSLLASSVPLTAIASSSYSYLFDGSKAIDGRLDTDWAAETSKEGILTIVPMHPFIVKSLWCLSRQTSLIEGWKSLNVKIFYNNQPMLTKSFSFPNAHRERILHVDFEPKLADRIELFFFDPVLVDPRGHLFSPESLHPGYTEILFSEN